jgi:SprT-like family
MGRKGNRPKTLERALLPIFDHLNDTYFGGLLVAGIGWRNLSLKQEEVIYGECHFEERFIKINTILKDAEVPDYFLEYVVYHEMCHLMYHPSVATTEGHDNPEHNARFKSIEKRYPMYKQSIDFDETKMPDVVQRWREYRNK